MSTLAHSARTAPSASTVRCAAVRWHIARVALHRLRPDLAGPEGPSVVIEFRLESGAAGLQGQVCIIDGARSTPLACLVPSPRAAWVRDDRGLDHIDIPGLLAATLRTSPAGVRLVYGRMTLLADWRLPGGRYRITADA